MKTGTCAGYVARLLLLSCTVSAQTALPNPQPGSVPGSLRAPYNPAPFQNTAATPSHTLLFLTSATGKKMAANFPPLAGYLSGMGVKVPPASNTTPGWAAPQPNAVVFQDKIFQGNIPCNTPAGALFNLEPATGSPELPVPAPQFTNTVDSIPAGGVLGADLVIAAGDDWRGAFDQFRNSRGAVPPQLHNAWGFTMSGYYVHRAGTDCSASFEGALPHIDFRPTQDVLYGYSPAVAIDSTRRQAYAVDVRFAATVNGLGLFRTTVSKLDDATHCANGTHLTDSQGEDTAASRCWPVRALLNAQRNIFPSTFSDLPALGVDERASGLGGGDIYVGWTNYDLFHATSYIQLIACPHDFGSRSSCSKPITISGNDRFTQYSHVAVRPDGVVSVTYVNVNFVETDTPPYERQTFDLKHVSCTPSAASVAPTCSQPSLIASEEWPIPFGSGGPSAYPTFFPTATFPVHDYRVNGNHVEEFVAWARCKVDPYYWVGVLPFQNCVDADVVFTWSVSDAAGVPLGWAPPVLVDERRRNQIMPALRTDQSRNTIELVYLSASQDAYNERYLVAQREIAPGTYAPGTLTNLISVPIESNADAFMPQFVGNSLGLSARGGRNYVSFTGEAYEGLIHETLTPGHNNLLLKF